MTVATTLTLPTTKRKTTTIQARKVPVQQLADRIAGKFTWVVFAASASTLVFWGALSPFLLGLAAGPAAAASTATPSYPALAEALGGGSPWALGLRLAVDVCLVACPCSLGLATPTAIMVSKVHGWVLDSCGEVRGVRESIHEQSTSNMCSFAQGCNSVQRSIFYMRMLFVPASSGCFSGGA